MRGGLVDGCGGCSVLRLRTAKVVDAFHTPRLAKNQSTEELLQLTENQTSAFDVDLPVGPDQ